MLLLLSLHSWADTLTATVDRNQLSRGETVELQVRFDGLTTSDPDFSALEQDFEILSQHQQNQFSIMNGSPQSYTQWTLQLLPKQTGRVLIPALQLKGVQSDPITLQVEKRTAVSTGAEPVFMETELDKSSVYVQEQLLLTLRLNTSVPLQGLSSEELMVKNASLLKVSENQYQKRDNGVLYQVVELKYALFPDTSGELIIPPVRFTAAIPDRRDPFSGSLFGSRGKPVFLFSEEQHVEVKPRPANYGSGDWLPAKGLSLSERWSRPLDELVAGEPVTRTINLTAQGLMDSQLPPLSIDSGEGFKVYPDQPQLENSPTGNGVIGSRIESIAIVPSRAGSITLPPIKIRWWDTTSQQVRETVLEGQTLDVKPAAGVTATPTPNPEVAAAATDTAVMTGPIATADTRRASLLVWVLIAFNLLLLIAVIVLFLLWQNSRDRSTKPQSITNDKEEESTLFKALQLRAREGNLRNFREALLLWAGAFWKKSLLTLMDISEAAGNGDFTCALDALDRALYSPDLSGNLDLNAICQQVKQLRKQQRSQKPTKGKTLAPLYDDKIKS
ncbi:BatD family protein [Porticoccus sp.]